MKRSEINAILRDAEAFIERFSFKLPPFQRPDTAAYPAFPALNAIVQLIAEERAADRGPM